MIKVINHQKFCQRNRKMLLFIDFLFITGVFANFGALLITNFLFIYSQPEKKISFYESNIVMAELHNFPQKQEINNGKVFTEKKSFLQKTWRYIKIPYSSLGKQLIIWVFLTVGFVFLRRSINTPEQLTSLLSNVITFWFILNYDFMNDLGFFLGVLFK